MTNYNERFDEVLDSYADYYNLQDINRFTKEQMSIEFPHVMTKDEAKQAITSLIKELVAEAKPDRSRIEYVYDRGFNDSVLIYEQNLLKALEEV